MAQNAGTRSPSPPSVLPWSGSRSPGGPLAGDVRGRPWSTARETGRQVPAWGVVNPGTAWTWRLPGSRPYGPGAPAWGALSVLHGLARRLTPAGPCAGPSLGTRVVGLRAAGPGRCRRCPFQDTGRWAFSLSRCAGWRWGCPLALGPVSHARRLHPARGPLGPQPGPIPACGDAPSACRESRPFPRGAGFSKPHLAARRATRAMGAGRPGQAPEERPGALSWAIPGV